MRGSGWALSQRLLIGRRFEQKKKEKRSARLEGREMKKEIMYIPHLFETFRLGERLFNTSQRKGRNEDSETPIVVISENVISHHPLVYQCPPDFELNN